MDIKKEVKELGNSNVQLDVTVGKDDVKESYDSVVNKYAKEAQIPGFRKGKVPISLLESRFGESLRMEAAYNLIDDALKQIFDAADKDIKPINYDQPELVGELKLDPEKDLQFSITYDVFPKANLQKTDGFTVKELDVSGEDEALENELKRIQRTNAVVINRKPEETAQSGDVATVNYCEVDENGNEIDGSAREDYAFELGSGQNYYKFDDEIIGMKTGDEKTFNKEYPADFEDEALKGKTKKLKVKLTALKFFDLPKIDDDLAQDVSEKYKTLDDLKADLKKNISQAVSTAVKNSKIDSYLDAVLDANDFVLPKSMVEADLRFRWSNMARQMGISVEKLNEIMERSGGYDFQRFADATRPASVKELKKRVVVEMLLEKHADIKAEDADFEAKYAEIAESSNMKIEDVRKTYATENYKHYLEDMIREDKLFKLVLDSCKIEKGNKIAATELIQNRGE